MVRRNTCTRDTQSSHMSVHEHKHLHTQTHTHTNIHTWLGPFQHQCWKVVIKHKRILIIWINLQEKEDEYKEKASDMEGGRVDTFISDA